MIVDIFKLKEISEIEFHDIIKDVIIEDINELRIILVDDSFIRRGTGKNVTTRQSFFSLIQFFLLVLTNP